MARLWSCSTKVLGGKFNPALFYLALPPCCWPSLQTQRQTVEVSPGAPKSAAPLYSRLCSPVAKSAPANYPGKKKKKACNSSIWIIYPPTSNISPLIMDFYTTSFNSIQKKNSKNNSLFFVYAIYNMISIQKNDKSPIKTLVKQHMIMTNTISVLPLPFCVDFCIGFCHNIFI